MSGPTFQNEVAQSIPFLGGTNGFLANDVQEAIEEARIFNPKFKTVILEDFLGVNTGGFAYGWQTLSRSSSGIRDVAPEAVHPGIIQVYAARSSGLAALGYCGVALKVAYAMGTGSFYMNAGVRVPALPDATNNAQYNIGLGDLVSAADQNNGIYFVIDRALSTTNWICRTAKAGVRTSVVTTVPITAAAWVTLGFTVNDNNTLATFFINGVQVAQITTNLPTAGTGILFMIRQIAGTTTERQLDVDWCEANKAFLGGR